MKTPEPNDIEVIDEIHGTGMTANEIKGEVSRLIEKDLSDWIFRFTAEGLEFFKEIGKESIYAKCSSDFTLKDVSQIVRVFRHYDFA